MLLLLTLTLLHLSLSLQHHHPKQASFIISNIPAPLLVILTMSFTASLALSPFLCTPFKWDLAFLWVPRAPRRHQREQWHLGLTLFQLCRPFTTKPIYVRIVFEKGSSGIRLRGEQGLIFTLLPQMCSTPFLTHLTPFFSSVHLIPTPYLPFYLTTLFIDTASTHTTADLTATSYKHTLFHTH